MNIVFFGSGEFGLPTLARLAATHEVRAVVTQPDRPAGRGGRLTPTPVAQWAATNLPAVEVIKPEKVSEAGVVARLRAMAGAGRRAGETDRSEQAALVVIAFGQKMPRALLDGVFAINLHASLLPRWRGAAPINAAILAGDRETGNSVITLADRMDAGLILGQTRRAIDPVQTAGELHDLLSADGPELVERVLRERELGETREVAQDESLVTKAAKLSKADGVPDFARTAQDVRRRVHGLTPWPGVSAMLGDVALKLLRVRAEEGKAAGAGGATAPGAVPGTLIDGGQGRVACGEGTVLQLLEVQPAGKRAMTWAEFVRGRRVETGATLAAPRVGAREGGGEPGGRA